MIIRYSKIRETYPVGVVVTAIEPIALFVTGLSTLVVAIMKVRTVEFGAVVDGSAEELFVEGNVVNGDSSREGRGEEEGFDYVEQHLEYRAA